MSEKPTGLYTKMALIMGEIQQIDKKNTMDAGSFSYKFVSDNAVYHKMRELLINHGLALFASMTDVVQERYVVGQDKWGNERDKFHTTARFEFTLVDSETGDTHTSVWYGESEDSADKGVNKCSTAALKYWLLKTFIIPTGDDPDASNGADLTDDKDDDQPARTSQKKPARTTRKSAPRNDRRMKTGANPPADIDPDSLENTFGAQDSDSSGNGKKPYSIFEDKRTFAAPMWPGFRDELIKAGLADNKIYAEKRLYKVFGLDEEGAKYSMSDVVEAQKDAKLTVAAIAAKFKQRASEKAAEAG